MRLAEVVVSEINRLHGYMMHEALAVGPSQTSEPLQIQSQFLIERFDMARANLIHVWRTENSLLLGSYCHRG